MARDTAFNVTSDINQISMFDFFSLNIQVVICFQTQFNILTSVFHVSFPFLFMNFVIRLSK